jgi:hypothetical protein
MSHINELTIKAISKAIESIQCGSGFGSVEVILHEGRITQIEKREKQRFQIQRHAAENVSSSTTFD